MQGDHSRTHYIWDDEQKVFVYRDLDLDMWALIVRRMMLYWPRWRPDPDLLSFYQERLRRYPGVLVWDYIRRWAERGEDFPPDVGDLVQHFSARHLYRIRDEIERGYRGEDGSYIPREQLLERILLHRQEIRDHTGS